jgi:hypothetical protein
MDLHAVVCVCTQYILLSLDMKKKPAFKSYLFLDERLKGLILKKVLFWFLTSCISEKARCFGGKYHLNFRVELPHSYVGIMLRSLYNTVDRGDVFLRKFRFLRTARCYYAQDYLIHIRCLIYVLRNDTTSTGQIMRIIWKYWIFSKFKFKGQNKAAYNLVQHFGKNHCLNLRDRMGNFISKPAANSLALLAGPFTIL